MTVSSVGHEIVPSNNGTMVKNSRKNTLVDGTGKHRFTLNCYGLPVRNDGPRSSQAWKLNSTLFKGIYRGNDFRANDR